MSKTISPHDYSDTLAYYGIGHLTSEACNYGMRIRYDVSAFGLKVFEEAFGVSIDREETMRNMNSKVFVRGVDRDDQVPAEYGIMMTGKQARDLLLFTLVSDSLNDVVVHFIPWSQGQDYYINEYIWIGTQEEWDGLRDDLENDDSHRFTNEHYHRHVYAKSNHPHSGSLNIHYMTGRAR